MTQIDYKKILYDAGRDAALALQAEAKDLDGTQIIARERDVPVFVEGKNYSGWPVGSPVSDDRQVWQLLQPYDSSAHPGSPGQLRALWGLCHTKNPAEAKPWVSPFGTSGMYMAGECYRTGETVYRCLANYTIHNAEALPEAWEVAL